LILNEDLAGNAARMGAILHSELANIQQQFRQIGRVDGKGLVAGVSCVKPGTREPDAPLAARIVTKCVEKGVLMFSPVGFGGATVKICPPLVIHEEALRESLDVFREALAEAVV
jgi:4-aminobutyrate aminotransferase-like enzyme